MKEPEGRDSVADRGGDGTGFMGADMAEVYIFQPMKPAPIDTDSPPWPSSRPGLRGVKPSSPRTGCPSGTGSSSSG